MGILRLVHVLWYSSSCPILFLQLSRWGRESWLLYFNCILPGIYLCLCSGFSSPWCPELVVCELWLWHFLVILTVYFYGIFCAYSLVIFMAFSGHTHCQFFMAFPGYNHCCFCFYGISWSYSLFIFVLMALPGHTHCLFLVLWHFLVILTIAFVFMAFPGHSQFLFLCHFLAKLTVYFFFYGISWSYSLLLLFYGISWSYSLLLLFWGITWSYSLLLLF